MPRPLNVGKLAVEPVNSRMRTACTSCGSLPQGARLKHTTGAGKWQKSEVYCQTCGEDYIVDELTPKINSLVDDLMAY